VLKIEPNHDGALNALAYLFAMEGRDLAQAKEMIKKAIDVDPTNGAYYDTLGWVLYKQGLYEESLMALQKATVYVQDAIVYDHMGDVYAALKELALARANWLKAMELNPQLPGLKEKIDVNQNVQLEYQQNHTP
jgi:Tfp pilus assembly protein PilF